MKIALLGDVSLNGQFDITKSNDVKSRVELIRELIQDCDFSIANLESPLTSRKISSECKGVYLKSAPENVEVLKYLGITHVTLANNHIFDYGKKGAAETIDTLKKAGIIYVGVGQEPVVIEKNGDHAMLGGFCCLSANGLYYGVGKNQINLMNFENVRKFLAYSKEKQCIPIVSAHFGIEHVHYPSTEHMKMFRELSEEFIYVLHGNHPHAIQGYENFKSSALFYSLGNLCFGDLTATSTGEKVVWKDDSRKCYIVKLEIENNALINYEVITLSELEDGFLKIDSNVKKELELYSEQLKKNYQDIERLRKKELQNTDGVRKKKNIQFFLARLNYRYIGAFINGKLHAKRYKKIYQRFK